MLADYTLSSKGKNVFNDPFYYLRLGWGWGPSAAAITCFKESILHYLRLG